MTMQAKVAAIMGSTTFHLKTLMLINFWWSYYPGRKFWTSHQQLLSSFYINSIIPVPWLSASSKEQQPERSYFSILSTGHLHFHYPVFLLCCSIIKRNKSQNTNHDYFFSETTTQRNKYASWLWRKEKVFISF